MMVRVLCALALCLLSVNGVRAEERPGLLHRVSCTIVRYYVAKYSAPAAEAWARSKGASDADIAKIHAPIGLAIGAVSPPEIAVAIMGQITARLREAEGA